MPEGGVHDPYPIVQSALGGLVDQCNLLPVSDPFKHRVARLARECSDPMSYDRAALVKAIGELQIDFVRELHSVLFLAVDGKDAEAWIYPGKTFGKDIIVKFDAIRLDANAAYCCYSMEL
jgi:hypothetical protein